MALPPGRVRIFAAGVIAAGCVLLGVSALLYAAVTAPGEAGRPAEAADLQAFELQTERLQMLSGLGLGLVAMGVPGLVAGARHMLPLAVGGIGGALVLVARPASAQQRAFTAEWDLWLRLEAVGWVLIAVALVYALWQARSATQNPRTPPA